MASCEKDVRRVESKRVKGEPELVQSDLETKSEFLARLVVIHLN